MMLRSLAALSLGVPLFALGSCGGTVDDTPSVAEPATTAPEGARGAGPSTAVPPATRRGSVSFSAIEFNVLADAAFVDSAPLVASSGCKITPRIFSSAPTLSAGNVAVTYPSSKGEPRRLALTIEDGRYGATDSARGVEDRRLEQPGGTVLFEASGGEVPAFSGELVVPERVKLVGERRADETAIGAILDAKSGRDIELAWSEGTHEQAQFFLTGAKHTVWCNFPAPARTGAIPAAMVAKLLAEGEVTGGECPKGRSCLTGGFYAVRSRNVRAAEYEVELRAAFWLPLSVEVAPGGPPSPAPSRPSRASSRSSPAAAAPTRRRPSRPLQRNRLPTRDRPLDRGPAGDAARNRLVHLRRLQRRRERVLPGWRAARRAVRVRAPLAEGRDGADSLGR